MFPWLERSTFEGKRTKGVRRLNEPVFFDKKPKVIYRSMFSKLCMVVRSKNYRVSALHTEKRFVFRTQFALWLIGSVVCFTPAEAIINYGYDNNSAVTTTDPGTGVPWDAVARVANWDGVSASNPSGSAMHLGNGYMLTADHVLDRSHVSFDGSNWYARDTSFTPIQVTSGVDLKVFKLTSSPSVSSVQLYDGVFEQVAPATMIGWGRGRDPATPVNTVSVPWGNNNTIDKRWGENELKSFIPSGSYSATGNNYTSQLLGVVLGSPSGAPSGLGMIEAAAATYDSGSGLFQNLGGTWQLIGLTVLAGNPSVFGDDTTAAGGGENFFVRISPYENDILAAVPEPNAYSLITAVLALTVTIRRRRS